MRATYSFVRAVLTLACALGTLSQPAAGQIVAHSTTETPLPPVVHRMVTFHARCDQGVTLEAVLQKVRPGDTIMVSGQCFEAVTVTTDDLTIDGGGSAILDGSQSATPELAGVLTIDGARGVVLRGLTVQNGSGAGVTARGGASIVVEEVDSLNNAGVGLLLEQSTARVADSEASLNHVGIDAITDSSLIMSGEIIADQNALDGIALGGSSVMELRNADVRMSNNFTGLVALSASQIVSWGFNTSSENTLAAENNVVGIVLGSSELTIFAQDTTVSASGNAVGLLVPGGQIVSTFGRGQFDIQGNQVGMLFTDNGGAAIDSGVLVENNAVGIQGDGAGLVSLGPTDGSPPADPLTIQSNGTDLLMSFGTRLQINDATVSTVVCDATVLSRGSTTCP